MVARRRRRVDRDGAQARAQVGGREDEVARERVGPLVAIVDAERRRLALARMQELAGVDESGRARIGTGSGHPCMQRVLGAQIEIAGEDRRDGVRLRLERVAGIAAGAVVEGMSAGLRMMRAPRRWRRCVSE